jgi:hypothetical protein
LEELMGMDGFVGDGIVFLMFFGLSLSMGIDGLGDR